MILQSLYHLYDRLKEEPGYQIAPPGYSLQRITFKVVIFPDGRLLGVQDARIDDGNRRVPRRLVVPGGGKPTGAVTAQSVNDKVLPLRNDLPFLVGARIEETVDAATGEKTRALEPALLEFDAFKRYHLSHESEVSDSGFSAVCRFLETWQPKSALSRREWADIGEGQGVFQVAGETLFVHDRPAVADWWRRVSGNAGHGGVGECLITGESAPLARIHPPIKGVRGGNTTGGAIVGLNEDAYWSYGKTQSFNSPVSLGAAFRYTTALNALLDGPMREKHRLQLGDTTVAFWTDRPSIVEDVFAPFATRGSEAVDVPEAQDEGTRSKLEAFLRALRHGRGAYTELGTDLSSTRYFLLGLSPNAARIAVRFFHQATLGELLTNLRRHYDDIHLEPQPAAGKRRADPEFPSLQLLLDQTCPLKEGRPDREKIPPILAGPLLRAVLTGSQYPEGLYTTVLRRLRDERGATYPRACVIKGHLNRNRRKEISMSLDPSRLDPAYRLGRLFAALEKTQRDALEGLNATIRDRFYASASATPGPVFPRLLRTYQHHLAKLDGGHKVNREKLVQEILDPLTTFPTHLGLPEQGLFALGYYHQTKSFYTAKTNSTDPDNEGSES